MGELVGVLDAVEVERSAAGVVTYRGTDALWRTPVLLKVAPAELLGALARVGGHQSAVERMPLHPNIVQVLRSGRAADGRPFVVTVDPGATRSLADEGRPGFDAPAALAGVIALAGALESAHGSGALHGGVSPAAVLVGVDGTWLLTDWVIAGAVAANRTPDRTADSAWLAPESAAGEVPSPATDVYGLAALLYYLLAGEPAFARPGDSPLTVVARIASEQPPDLASLGVPGPVAAAVTRGMARAPAERFGSAGEFGRALQMAQAELGLPVTEMTIRGSQSEEPDLAGVPDRPASPPPPAEPVLGGFVVVCPACGFQNTASASFCASCGALLEFAGEAIRTPASAPPPPPPAVAVHDDVQFTVYRPSAVRPARWYPLLAFAHRGGMVAGDDGEMIDPVQVVERQARAILSDQEVPFDSVRTDATESLAIGSDLVLEPWLDEGEFNPPRASVQWVEHVHRVEFRMRVPASADGRRVNGGLRVFSGPVLVGELTFRLAVSQAAAAASAAAAAGRPADSPASQAPDVAGVRETVRPFRQIFASYAHADAAVVEAVARYVSATGDRYFIDVQNLRAGERWERRLEELIEEADVFQLFWSHNAMRSRFVRQEIDYALSLGRDYFVRPVYWEDPLPVDEAAGLPPEAVRSLHFSRLGVATPVLAPPPPPQPAGPPSMPAPAAPGAPVVSPPAPPRPEMAPGRPPSLSPKPMNSAGSKRAAPAGRSMGPVVAVAVVAAVIVIVVLLALL